MKSKLYAIGAMLLALALGLLTVLVPRSKRDNERVRGLEEKLSDKAIQTHKKAANEAFRSAKKHTQKAKEIARRKTAAPSSDIKSAVSDWNDDDL